jgi:ABC-2 type transport system ATP-binding protein
MEPVIHAEHLTREFGPVRAVDDLSLEVPAGSIFGFLGPNGAGKTTMIRLLLGLLEPTAGRASVLGYDVQTQADQIRQRSGALLEYAGLYERLSAADNLEFYGRIWHLAAGERQARIKELLTHLGLWERRKDAVNGWSRGMRQKLAIARTLLHRPALVFLDEPTAGLDPIAAATLRADLAGLAAREQVTIFLTTHNLTEAEAICTQVGVIRQGRLLAVGSPANLRSRIGTPQAQIIGHGFSDTIVSMLAARPEVADVARQNGNLLLTLRGAPDLAPLVSAVAGAGGAIEEVHKGQASLEDVFVTLMEEAR